jgi:pimeloyl-ACP methyl ester carboxylesterase
MTTPRSLATAPSRSIRRHAAGGVKFRLMWAGAQIASRLPGTWPDGYLGRFWFTPWTSPRPPRPLPDGARWLDLDTAVGPLAAWELGEGPTVLLIHGWGGRSQDFVGIADTLADAGFRAVAVDLPGHGRSSGGPRTHVPEMADALRAIVAVMGPPAAVVAHSAGGLALGLALEDSFPDLPIVLVAPLVTLDSALRWFAATARLPLRGYHALRRHIDRGFGADVWHRARLDRAPLTSDVLVVADERDDRVPPDEVGALLARHGHARLVTTCGRGHNGVLGAPEVLTAVAAFLTATVVVTDGRVTVA